MNALPVPAAQSRAGAPVAVPGVLIALLVAASVLWIAYSVTGLRSPMAPIIVSDEDSGSGLRQALFTLCGAIAFAVMVIKREAISLPVAHWRATALCALAGVSLLWSIDPTLSLKRSVVLLFGLAWMMAMVGVLRRPARTMLVLVTVLMAIVSVASLASWVALPADRWSIEERPGLAGLAGHPNTLGAAMAIGLITSLGVGASAPKARLAMLAARASMLLALFLTDSITSWGVAAAGLAVHAILTAQRYRRGVYTLGAVVIGVMVVLSGPSGLKDSALEAVGRESNLSGRCGLWEPVLAEGMKSPLVGNGYGAFWYEGRGREIVGTWNPRQSHNAYLDVFLDLGIVGLVSVLALLGSALYIGWMRSKGSPGSDQRRASAAILAVAIAELLVYGLSESFLLKPDKLPFIAVCWAALLLVNPGINRIEREHAPGVAR